MLSGARTGLLRLMVAVVLAGGAAVVHAQALLYQQENFQGRTFSVNHEAVNLASVGFNDQASSLFIRGGRWQLCTAVGFRGRCVTPRSEARYPSLRLMGLNNQISSLRRIGVPPPVPAPPPIAAGRPGLVLYEHDNFAGRALPVSREIANLVTVGFNDLASSVQIRSGRWLLCRDAGYRGPCVTLAPGRYPSLRAMGLNDQLSSVRRVGR